MLTLCERVSVCCNYKACLLLQCCETVFRHSPSLCSLVGSRRPVTASGLNRSVAHSLPEHTFLSTADPQKLRSATATGSFRLAARLPASTSPSMTGTQLRQRYLAMRKFSIPSGSLRQRHSQPLQNTVESCTPPACLVTQCQPKH